MKHSSIKLLSLYAELLLFFLVFLVGFIFIGFWLNVTIASWTIPLAFISYTLIIYVVRDQIGVKAIELGVFFILVPIVFFAGTSLYNQTYDTSYDGNFYHEPAVAALADQWNPVYKPVFPLKTPDQTSTPLIEGSPKAIWSVDAAVYKLSNKINAVPFINLVVTLIAFAFAFGALKLLGLSERKAFLVALVSLATPLLIDQFFSFREDGLSYSLLVIGISSLIKIARKQRQITYYICLLGVLLLLAGAKFSNLYIFLGLGLLGTCICLKVNLFHNKRIHYFTAVFVVVGSLVLFNPFVTNTFKFHALDFPYNQNTYAQLIKQATVPANIRQSSKLQLFFYGIFSSSQINNANNPAYYANLKVPFTFTSKELISDALDTAKLVGGYGIFFSGIFIISIISYLYIFIRSKKPQDKKVLKWASLSVILILISCLLMPAPNYARYTSQLYLLPIVMVVALFLVSYKNKPLSKVLSGGILLFLLLNFYIEAVPAIALREGSFDKLNTQLSSIEHSHKKYRVYSGLFYSSYIELRSHNISIEPSNNPLSCKARVELVFPPLTQLCPIK